MLMALFFPFPLGWFHLLVLLLLPIFFLLKQKKKRGREGTKLPPSPPSLPIIGHLHQLGKLPHQNLWKLSQKYGPVMLLQLGSIPTLVISSADMAEQVMKTHDLDCCSRPPSPGPKKLSYNFLDVAFSPYSSYWREMRKLFIAELLSPKRAQSLWNARKDEVNRLITSISKTSPSPCNLNENIYSLADSIVGAVAFGKSYGGMQFQNQNFQDVLDEAMDILGSFSAEDFFPSSVGRFIDALRGFRARADKSFRDLDGYFQMVLDEHLDPTRPKRETEDLVDVLVRLSEEDPRITKDHIKAVLMNTFVGGIDTSSITIVWAMTELMKNPRVLNKVQAEIRGCVGKNAKLDQDDMKNLKYLKMVIKETFRKHPPVVLLIPRETMRHCKIGGDNGYEIYPKTRILVNAWAIGRDPKSWENPDEFYPERFEDNDIDFNGKHFQLVPFGAGRRICPGLAMGVATVEFTLANLLYWFDWELPNGMAREAMSMEEDGGITVHKKTPLYLVPIKYIWQESE